MRPLFSAVVRPLKALPIMHAWIDRRRYAHFCSPEGFASHYGVFENFAQARNACPSSPEFNQQELADEYEKIRMHKLYPYDYPVLYWLSRSFLEGSKNVFDIGGSVGVHYHAYQQVLDYPDEATWIVCETPEIVKIGREIAALRGNDRTDPSSAQIMFTDSLETTHLNADVWISAGALQYIENARFSRLIADCLKPPAHIILNKLPLYNGRAFVTAQNIGKNSFAPSYVYNRLQFIREIESMGYSLIDSWDVLERSFYLPGHPEKSFKNFSGLYFKAIENNL